jgi:hypothetical protein
MDEPSHPFDPAFVPYVADLPHIMTHWYTNPRYVESNGHPKRLRLRAPGACLAALVRQTLPKEDAREVAEALIQMRAVRRHRGWYEAVDRSAWFRGASLHAHGLMSVAGILRTVQHNDSCGDRSMTLLESAATNAYIPVRALPVIHDRIKRDVMDLLSKIDVYLRRWEVAPGSEPTTRVGLGAYAFEDPIVVSIRSVHERLQSREARRPRQRRLARER